MGSSAQNGSGVRRCGSQAQFRRQVPEGSARFRRVLVQVPEAGFGKFRSVGGGGRCKGSGRFVEGSGESRARRRFWRVLLAYKQNNAPMCRFEIEKANAHDTATYALLLLGIPPKLICCNAFFWFWLANFTWETQRYYHRSCYDCSEILRWFLLHQTLIAMKLP